GAEFAARSVRSALHAVLGGISPVGYVSAGLSCDEYRATRRMLCFIVARIEAVERAGSMVGCGDFCGASRLRRIGGVGDGGEEYVVDVVRAGGGALLFAV